MARVNVIVEGPTEESFIKNVLAPNFWPRGIYVTPFVLGVPGHKGGNVNYARVRKDILIQLTQDRNTYCTTMLDLYALGEGFPGPPAPAHVTGVFKALHIEQHIAADIAAALPGVWTEQRFLPYLQVHEYEGLLFSNPEEMAAALGRPVLAQSFREIRDLFETPEHINNDPNTAPSKRILRAYPSYRKVIEGTIAAGAVGLEAMVRECPHFRTWTEKIAAVAS